jgi:hypothetical protein
MSACLRPFPSGFYLCVVLSVIATLWAPLYLWVGSVVGAWTSMLGAAMFGFAAVSAKRYRVRCTCRCTNCLFLTFSFVMQHLLLTTNMLCFSLVFAVTCNAINTGGCVSASLEKLYHILSLAGGQAQSD